jgi:flagellar L-ring protein precursor FlgH
MRHLLAMPCLVVLAGCATDIRDIGREPHMTPVGTGLQADVAALGPRDFPPPSRNGDQSLWDNGRADLFRDPRATRVGDVVTVLISIDDKAKLDNTTDRSLDSKASSGFDVALGMTSKQRKANGLADTTSTSSTNGQGSIDRSEKISVALGAVVQGVLPDGNLVISGSQEVRVNFELRMLNIAGIVRPRDISKDNTISYDKIAEARIAYGGRGRITEVQQPQWGQQIYDWLKPF